MVKVRNIVLITVIGILVIFSGCTENQEKKSAETAQPTPVQNILVQPTPVQSTAASTTDVLYQVQVTEVKTLTDCIVSPGSSEIKPCTFINLQIKNNDVKNLDFKIVKENIIAKNSMILPGRYDKEVGLNDQCTRLAGMEFVLADNTQRNIGLCHPTINKVDEPVLRVETLIKGERKEYEFILT
jgi:hypothetical protein